MNTQTYTELETERRGQKVILWVFEYIEQFRQQLHRSALHRNHTFDKSCKLLFSLFSQSLWTPACLSHKRLMNLLNRRRSHVDDCSNKSNLYSPKITHKGSIHSATTHNATEHQTLLLLLLHLSVCLCLLRVRIYL